MASSLFKYHPGLPLELILCKVGNESWWKSNIIEEMVYDRMIIFIRLHWEDASIPKVCNKHLGPGKLALIITRILRK